ncbi:hypothetical protein BG000_010887 [Podila horticola]|nr:hypothetical protein BG000_010887 [Podila horticola]
MRPNCLLATAIMVILATSSMGAAIPPKQEIVRSPIAMALTSVPLANQLSTLYRRNHGEKLCKDKAHEKHSETEDDDDDNEDEDRDHNGNHDNHENHDGHVSLDDHGHGDHGQDGASADHKGVDSHDHTENDAKPTPSSGTTATPTLMPSTPTGYPHSSVSSGANAVFGQAHIAVGLISVVIAGFLL